MEKIFPMDRNGVGLLDESVPRWTDLPTSKFRRNSDDLLVSSLIHLLSIIQKRFCISEKGFRFSRRPFLWRVPSPRFEPRQEVPKSRVPPLHHGGTAKAQSPAPTVIILEQKNCSHARFKGTGTLCALPCRRNRSSSANGFARISAGGCGDVRHVAGRTAEHLC